MWMILSRVIKYLCPGDYCVWVTSPAVKHAPAELYDAIRSCFGVYKVLLSLLFLLRHTPKNPAKFTKKILQNYIQAVFSILVLLCIMKLTKERPGNMTYVVAQNIKFDFGYGP